MEDIFSRLLNLTSHISRQLVQFIEDLVFREINIFSGRLVGVSRGSSQFSSSYAYTSCIYNSEACSSSSSNYSENTRFVVHDRETTDLDRHFYANSRPVILVANYGCRGIHSILKGLFLPLFGLRFAWRLALATWRFYFSYIRSLQCRVRRAICRVKRTLHGSSDEIGWLQRAPGMPPVTDGSDRFEELLLTIQNGEHRLPDSYIYLLIPGLFSNHGPLYFVSTKKFFSKMGLACHIAKIHSEASVEHNALELKHYIEELYWGSGKSVMLLGHSKGGVDAAAALTLYWSDLKEKVAGLALVQSPYGGTPLASDILREGQIADRQTRRMMELFICRIVKGDIRALEDLTYEKRKEFIKNHDLPLSIPLISFHSEANVGLAVLGTMAHIAQAELPRIPFLSSGNDVVVPVVVPVGAILAVSAVHLRLRYGEESDGLVTRRDAEVPGSVVVRPRRKLDHAWMVYSSWREESGGTVGAREMCEALFTMLVEIGKKKMKMTETG